MDERRFDQLTRIISAQPDRRSMLKAASGGALAILGATVLGRTADAQDVVAEGKGFKGSKCDDNNDCKKGLQCNNKNKCEYKRNCGGKKGDACRNNNDCCSNKNLKCKGNRCKRNK